MLIAGKDSHGAGAHDWGDGVDLLHNALANESGLALEVAVHKGGWPENPAIFNDAATVAILSDGGGRHPINKYLQQFDQLAEKGPFEAGSSSPHRRKLTQASPHGALQCGPPMGPSIWILHGPLDGALHGALQMALQ